MSDNPIVIVLFPKTQTSRCKDILIDFLRTGVNSTFLYQNSGSASEKIPVDLATSDLDISTSVLQKYILGGNFKSRILVLCSDDVDPRIRTEEFWSNYSSELKDYIFEYVEPRTNALRPIYRPLKGNPVLTQRFLANPAYYKQFGFCGHEGVDWGVPEGTEVYSVARGTVVHASNLRWSSPTPSNYGNHIVINHGDWCSVYAHLKTISSNVGDYVGDGTLIGYSGKTGNSTGPHLHFGMLKDIRTEGSCFPKFKYGWVCDPKDIFKCPTVG